MGRSILWPNTSLPMLMRQTCGSLMSFSFTQLLGMVERIHELIWGRFMWCGWCVGSARYPGTAPHWSPLGSWLCDSPGEDKRLQDGCRLHFLPCKWWHWKFFSKSRRSKILTSVEEAPLDLGGSLIPSTCTDLYFLPVSRDKSLSCRSDAGKKYISCCELLRCRGDESPPWIRGHLRRDDASVAVNWLGHRNSSPGEYHCKSNLPPRGTGYTFLMVIGADEFSKPMLSHCLD